MTVFLDILTRENFYSSIYSLHSIMADKIEIDALQDLKEKPIIDNVPVLQNQSDFDTMYPKCIISNGINFLNDPKTKIIKNNDESFLIGKQQADGRIL